MLTASTALEVHAGLSLPITAILGLSGLRALLLLDLNEAACL